MVIASRVLIRKIVSLGIAILLAVAAPVFAAADGAGNAREDLIDSILALAEAKFKEADGEAQRAHFSGDIYVCKSFTGHLFNRNRDGFCLAAYPDVRLAMPENLPKDACVPYAYGVAWKDIPAMQGNPFFTAASFRYDKTLSAEENIQNARVFLAQAKRGDFLQMAARYHYGTGPHSMIITRDYDEAADSFRWTDSNMLGYEKDGIRYGYVQYDAEEDIGFFVDAICQEKFGATLYRLRYDIRYAEDLP